MLSVRWLWGSKQRFQWAAESQGTQPEEKQGLEESLVLKITSAKKPVRLGRAAVLKFSPASESPAN